MKFSEYLKQNDADTKYTYVGSVYGDDNDDCTGAEIAEMMQSLGDDSPIIDHPANTNRGGGFYFESGDIWYQSENNLVQECVFEEIE